MSKNLMLVNVTQITEQSFHQQKQRKPVKLGSIKIIIPKRKRFNKA